MVNLYKPMLAKIGSKEDLNKKGYIFEPKLDGTRAICYKNKEIKLINRRNRDITFRYPEFDFSKNINAKSCVLDGEIIIYDKNGNPNFNLLQSREQLDKKLLIELRSKEFPATYVVFDILYKNKKDLTNLPLIERKRILRNTIKESKYIQTIFYTLNGKDLWREVTKRKLEGVMAKNISSKYSAGERSADWLKIKFLKSIDCIIVGYTQERRIISALALAVYDKGKLIYIGRVGTGFTEEFLQNLLEQLRPLQIKNAPVKYLGKEKINWVKPELVCEVKFLEISKDNILRAPVFLRMRNDKPAKECTLREQIPL